MKGRIIVLVVLWLGICLASEWETTEYSITFPSNFAEFYCDADDSVTVSVGWDDPSLDIDLYLY